MRSWHLWRGLLAGLVVSASVAMAAPMDAEYIPLAEITPGMTGYGLTVFGGASVDTFGVTVIGVQENVRAAGSLLLIEVSGHDLETSSIAQGMSGSPIYLDGRFAGALAFGWGGSLKPIAGVTPAAEMLALPTDLPPGRASDRRDLSVDLSPWPPLNRDVTELAADIWPGAAQLAAGPPATAAVTGWPDAPEMWLRLAGTLAEGFPALDLSADQWFCQPLGGALGAGGGQDAARGERLVPGAACAVPLVVGDASLGAIGTVTWVGGDEVLMMGHPFMQRGPINLPLATARILTILPSRQMSFKMGSVGQIVGTVHHDLRAGLSGRMGPVPAMVPVTVTVRQGTDTGTDYHFEVVADPFLTPTLVFWSLYNAVLVTGDDASLQTTRYQVATNWSGAATVSEEPLLISGVTAGPGGAAGLAGEVITPLKVLLNNPYSPVRLESVHATLTQTKSLATATVIGLSGPQRVLRPGEQIVFRATVEPRQGRQETIDFPVTVPPQLAPGPYRVVVASAAELFALESQRAAGRFQPESLAGIMDILRAGRGRDTLVLALFSPGEGTVLRGRELPNLPPSVARTVRNGNLQAQRTLADYALRVEQKTAWALSGHAVRSLRIQAAPEPFSEERRP